MNIRDVIREGWFTLTPKQRVVVTLAWLFIISVFVWGLICRCG